MFVALTGGVHTTLFGLRIQSRDPFRALALSLLLFGIGAARYRGDLTWYIDQAIRIARDYAGVAALGLAALLGAHAIAFGSFGIGGSDSYGYVNQAYQWKAGALPQGIPLTMALELPDSDEIQIPLGYRRGQQPHTMVPTYAPGLPLMMAVALFAGACGPYFVTPICAAFLVWFTYRLGVRAGGMLTGLAAAILVATTPVVLFQALWPMSDVPAGALWTGAFFYAVGGRRRDVAAAAFCTFLGLLVRPNLFPLALVPLAAIVLTGRGLERWIRAAFFSVPVAGAALFIAWLNTVWYGGPSNTGYGSTAEIYLASNIIPNLRLYGSWLWQSGSPWVSIALVPFLPVFIRKLHAPTIALCAAACAVTFACYVTYSQFEVWWYLRFLLPAAGTFAVLLASGFTAVGRSIKPPYGYVAAVAGVWLMMAAMVSFAADKGVFGVAREGERRYIIVGEFLARTAPRNAALFSGQHSGSLRFYSGLVTLRFDWVKPAWAATVVPAVERAGYHPYLAVDDWELTQLRSQFGFPPDSPLPWPIVARLREFGGFTVFDMGSRAAGASPVAMEPRSEHWCEPRHPIVGPSQR